MQGFLDPGGEEKPKPGMDRKQAGAGMGVAGGEKVWQRRSSGRRGGCGRRREVEVAGEVGGQVGGEAPSSASHLEAPRRRGGKDLKGGDSKNGGGRDIMGEYAPGSIGRRLGVGRVGGKVKRPRFVKEKPLFPPVRFRFFPRRRQRRVSKRGGGVGPLDSWSIGVDGSLSPMNV